MHGNHPTLADFTLFLWAGSMFAAGLGCILSSQMGVLADFLKGRGR